MEKEIKIGGKTFTFVLPEGLSEENIDNSKLPTSSVSKVLNDWAKLIEDSKKEKEDEWYEHPLVPGYIFKNLAIVSDSSFEQQEESSEITIKFEYDSFEKKTEI